MLWLKKVLLKLGFIKKGNRFDEELSEEMKLHLEMIVEENLEAGMSETEARRAALKRFGNLEYFKEDCRASWGMRMVDDMVNDFRYGLRQILKHKVHTAIIVLTLAICMGSNTTAYNFVVKIVSKPYDYVEPDRIVQVGKKWTKLAGNTVNQIAVPHYEFFKEHCTSFTEIGFVDNDDGYDLDLDGNVRRISLDKITPEVWGVTGVQAIRGRVFKEDDVTSTEGRVIVLGENLWRDLGGQEQDILGQDLLINNVSYRIIGVVPTSFYLGYSRADAWIPRIFKPWEQKPDRRHDHSYSGIAKLKPDVSIEQANQNLHNVYERFMELYPEDREDQERTGADFGAVNINASLMQNMEQIGIAFKSIQLVTLVVLIIGCLNVGGMILVKGYSRIQELAMRKAMGASVFRLARQIYVEIITYFLLGGLCSLLILKLGFWGGQYLRLDEIPWAGAWSIDSTSLFLTVGIAMVAAILTGLMPLISILRRELMDFVKAGNRTMAGSISKHRLHAIFVISQVSLSVILLITAGVLVRNLNAVLEKSVGFEREGRVAFTVPQPGYRFAGGEEGYKRDVIPYQDRILERIQPMPGVISVSASNRVPISVDNMGHSNFSMHHYQYAQGEPEANALRMVIRPGYFETVGTKLLLGREFANTDTFESESVVIISQNLMERYYEGLNPIGMSIKFWGRDLKIVGVAEQVQDKPYFMDWDEYTLYFPMKQWHSMGSSHTIYVAHVRGDPVQQMATIERAILDVDSKATITSMTFQEHFEIATFAQELPMIMTVLFASLALFLSGLGLYGLISFVVAERTKEYGIRMALGAGRGNIFQRVLSGSGRLIGWGLVVGLAISFFLCVKINPILVDVNTTNPITFVTVTAFVVVICVFATLFPAQRATRINISETLQY